MAWLVVCKNGEERVYVYKPYRENICGYELWTSELDSVILPKGSIKKLIGREMNWSDEPVELK